jgi:hypothetical protein
LGKKIKTMGKILSFGRVFNNKKTDFLFGFDDLKFEFCRLLFGLSPVPLLTNQNFRNKCVEIIFVKNICAEIIFPKKLAVQTVFSEKVALPNLIVENGNPFPELKSIVYS